MGIIVYSDCNNVGLVNKYINTAYENTYPAVDGYKLIANGSYTIA